MNLDDQTVWVYGIFREDLGRAYVGATGDVRKRIDTHRGKNRNGLWTDGTPRVFILAVTQVEHYAIIERTWYELLVNDGWHVPHRPSWHYDEKYRPRSLLYFEEDDLSDEGELHPELVESPKLLPRDSVRRRRDGRNRRRRIG